MAFSPAEPSSKLEEKLAELRQKTEPTEYNLEDFIEEDTDKTVITVWGEKNGAKTATAYGLMYPNDTAVVFSFDHQSKRATNIPFIVASGVKITVLNMMKLEDKSSIAANLRSANASHQLILSMIAQVEEKLHPDWIIFDCTDEMHKICERVMRSRQALTPYSGTTNQNVWKERNDIMDDIHHKAVNASKKGVIYTVYSEENEIILAGNVLERTKVPKWIASVMRESTLDVHAESSFNKLTGKTKYTSTIKASKDQQRYPDGEYDTTGRCLRECLTKQE